MSAAGGGAATTRAPRRLAVPRFGLECGAVLRDLTQAYHLDGALAPGGRNLVLVFHALTGDADAAGPATGWWRDVVGPGRPVDTDRYAVLCPNLLGSCYGTTWRAVEWDGTVTSRHPERSEGSRWSVPDRSSGGGEGRSDSEIPRSARDDGSAPPITTRDQARFAALLVESLGVPLDAGALALVAGGSLGGMVALEWAATYPDSARAAAALAAPAAHPAWAVAWNHLQRRALDLAGPGREGAGLALAREIAMLSYRTAGEFDARFGRARGEGGFAVEGYLDRHGERLVARFDARAYRALLDAMDAHDVGRGRGGVGRALRRFAGRLLAVGVPGDVLYDHDVVRAWAEEAGARYQEVRSAVGHDAFLVEGAQVGAILGALLADVAAAEARPRGGARREGVLL